MFKIDAGSPLPIYAQLEQAIKRAVISGALAGGAQVPTVRQLAVDLKINANTVSRVYMELERRGVLETRRGIGTFVTERGLAPEVAERERAAWLAGAARQFCDELLAAGYRPEEITEVFQKLLEKEK